jgi:hypothetical protein
MEGDFEAGVTHSFSQVVDLTEASNLNLQFAVVIDADVGLTSTTVRVRVRDAVTGALLVTHTERNNADASSGYSNLNSFSLIPAEGSFVTITFEWVNGGAVASTTEIHFDDISIIP